jgi:uncharacterized protein
MKTLWQVDGSAVLNCYAQDMAQTLTTQWKTGEPMTDHSALMDKLNAVHDFPCSYIFKVIGENSSEFMARVVQAVVQVVGDPAELSMQTRESSGGKHLSVTLSVTVEDARSVVAIYDLLAVVKGVRFML